MGPFLDTSVFQGDLGDGDAGASAGQARFAGLLMFANWTRAEVEAILPKGLEPAPNGRAPDLHPIFFVAGEQTDGAVVMGGFTVPTGIRYHEVVIGVPFIRHQASNLLRVYIARMYSSYFPAVWEGNMRYGFAKQLAHIRADGTALAVAGDNGRALLRADLPPAGSWSPAACSALANFEAARAVFGLPVLGRRSDGRWLSCRFDWTFDDALVRPVDALVSIDAELGPGLPPRRCSAVSGGAFEVRGMLWRLSWPAPCRF